MQFYNQPLIAQKQQMLWLIHTLGSLQMKDEKSLPKQQFPSWEE